MTTMLIIIVLYLGGIQGVHLGDFASANKCEAASKVAALHFQEAGVLDDVDAAAFVCVARPEA